MTGIGDEDLLVKALGLRQTPRLVKHDRLLEKSLNLLGARRLHGGTLACRGDGEQDRIGQLGKQDNCQVAVSLSIANHDASLPVAYRLYLPQEWTQDRERWRKAGIPKDTVFKTKPQIALDQIREACEAGLPRGVVLMDAGYGANTDLRTDIAALGLS
jgi:hypothetical protein